MNKTEFLYALRQSLKGFSREEVDKVIGYYDELISDRVEAGQDEYRVVNGLGDIKYISRQIQADLAGERLSAGIAPYSRKKYEQQHNEQNGCGDRDEKKEKKSGVGTFFLILRLFSAPALIPLGIVFFVLWFAMAVVVASLVFSFGVSTVACAVSIIFGLVVGASQGGIGFALMLAGVMMLCAGVFGLLTVVTVKIGKITLKYLLKAAVWFVRLLYKKQ